MYSHFYEFLEDISDPVYIMDPEGAIRYLNSPARGVLGLEDEEADDSLLLSDCHPGWAERLIREEAVPLALQNGRWRGESALLTRDGIELPVSQTISVQSSSAGKIVRLSSVLKIWHGRYFEKTRQIDRLTQLETLVRLSQNVLEEDRREQVIKRVVSAACELAKGNIGIYCTVSAEGGVSIESSCGRGFPGSGLSGDIEILLSASGAADLLIQGRSRRMDSDELSSWLGRDTAGLRESLKHLVCARLAQGGAEGTGLIIVGNSDNVAFTPEDEAMLTHMATFTELALNHIASNYEAGRRSREMELIFANLKEAVMVCDACGSPIMTNPACVDSLGFDPTGFGCRHITKKMQLQHPDGSPVLDREMPFARALQGESVIDERYYGHRGDGDPFVYVISSTPLYSDEEVIGAVTVWRDETYLEKLTNQLISEQSALQTIIRSAPEGIIVVDEKCRITMANPTAVSLFGRDLPFSRPIPLIKDLGIMYPNGSLYDPYELPLVRSVFKGEVLIDQEIAVSMPDGSIRYLLVNTTPIKNQDEVTIGGVGVIHDITRRRSEKMQLQQDKDLLETRVAERTEELEALVETLKTEIEERKRVESELRESRRELRLMSRRTLEALEADKQAVAKELHDSIGASLAAIKFSLEERLSSMKSVPDVDTVSLEKIVSYLMYTIKETKRISSALRPTTLDDLGLLATIEWFCREFSTFYKQIRVTQEISIRESDLSDAMKIVLYRILQESLNNAAKHANPSSIHFTLAKKNGGVEMTVQDDGQGFELNSSLFTSDPLSGHGIEGMRERAEICGGRFEIQSRQGEGTRITVELPY